MIGRSMGVGHQDRGPPRGGDLEDRAARPRKDQVAGGERLGEPGLVLQQGVARDVAGGGEALAGRLEVAAAGDVQDVEVAFGPSGRP